MSSLNQTELSDADRRLMYRARRGLKELDFYLDPYVREHFAQADAEEKAVFAQLMAAEDPDLMDWFLLLVPPPEKPMQTLIHRIRALRGSRSE